MSVIEFPKKPLWRSRSYLDYVKTLPCVITGAPADDPHHVCGLGLERSGKVSDWAVIPVTRKAHNHIHAMPGTWQKQWQWLFNTLRKAYADEVLFFHLPDINDHLRKGKFKNQYEVYEIMCRIIGEQIEGEEYAKLYNK